jgi:hypothetical protein
MDQVWVPLQGGCTLWAAVGWEEAAGGGGSGGVSGDDGGDGAVHMNGVLGHAAAGKICAVGDGSVVVAVEVVVVAVVAVAAAAAAVGTCPGTGSLVGD